MTQSSLGYDIEIWVHMFVGRTSNGYTGIIENHDRHLCRRNWQWVRSKEFGSDVSKDRNGERWWLLTQWWMLLGNTRQNTKALKPSCRVEISSKPWLKSQCRPSSVSYSLGSCLPRLAEGVSESVLGKNSEHAGGIIILAEEPRNRHWADKKHLVHLMKGPVSSLDGEILWKCTWWRELFRERCTGSTGCKQPPPIAEPQLISLPLP